ncbi:beta-N-acetylhexosaminidase [Paraglaciecola aquimarina]|uniref:beta-N-acetylhexosaminidase n=1 Tax=Paraglaciecola aquimarina TaxID=1235557 RepID=A0ABU3SUW9_9ALTE|nr:beta-N-acetylhexosaminidase [Paraglaciecola aquimarina]MDU0353805.1 beta-N-acetylhexosaminidase [Paraglaciecola aquimarina]
MKWLYAFGMSCFLLGCSQQPIKQIVSDVNDPPLGQQLSLIPYPNSVQRLSGSVVIHDSVQVVVEKDAVDRQPVAKEASKVNTALQALENVLARLNLSNRADGSTKLTLRMVDQSELGDEGYRLDIKQNIVISANTETGLFYGIQTFRQLLPTRLQSSYLLPRVHIIDRPTFSWRGNMLDVARSFLPIEYLKAHIDRMARFKLNRLHIHLTDDQGWRVEIKGYPKLTEIGGASAVEGGRSGFYSQVEIQDLVSYAQQRHVILVPEVDLPGHTQAAIAAYNQLACDDVTNLAPYSGVKVGFSKLCLTQPEVIYPFVKDVLSQIAVLFPSEYIHIGGDEIKDPLYPEFIAKATRMVEALGRTAIAWEEGSVADNNAGVLLQLWNDKYDIQPALDKGHQLILSPCSYSYFDHGNFAGQPNTYDWCRKEGVPLERAYQLNPQAFMQVLGVESAMWSELVHTNATADNRLWPRLLVTAELGWSQENTRDYAEFLGRLDSLMPVLEQLNIQYYQE